MPRVALVTRVVKPVLYLLAVVPLAYAVARLMNGPVSITPRAYGKLYSGAPGANAESKPELS